MYRYGPVTKSKLSYAAAPQFQESGHKPPDKECESQRSRENMPGSDARAIKRAPETTRIMAILWRSQEKAKSPKGSRYFSRACMRNGHKYGADVKKYPFKGASSPLLKHHDRLTAEHSQRNRCPARSFHGDHGRRSRCPRCSRGGGRAICI